MSNLVGTGGDLAINWPPRTLGLWSAELQSPSPSQPTSPQDVAKLLATHARLKEDAGINFCLRDSGSRDFTAIGIL